jgi:hypothetical protein
MASTDGARLPRAGPAGPPAHIPSDNKRASKAGMANAAGNLRDGRRHPTRSQAACQGVGRGPGYTVTKVGKSDCKGTSAECVATTRMWRSRTSTPDDHGGGATVCATAGPPLVRLPWRWGQITV